MALRSHFDNASHSSDKWEPYFDVYERHLKHFALDLRLYRPAAPINFVEVGVQKGGSLDMWRGFFGDNCQITGIDVDPECAKLQYSHPNTRVVIGDQGDPTFWDQFLSTNKDIDIFIDDGGHYMNQQILTFEKVFPTMPVGSVFICEDTHTSYMQHNGGGLNRKGTFIEYAKKYIDVLHYGWKENYTTDLESLSVIGKDLTSVHFYDSMVVFEKFGKKDMRRVTPNNF